MKELAQLDQSTRLKGKRNYTLRDDGLLRVVCAERGRHQDFMVEVAHLNPEPIRDKRKATDMLVAMCIFGFFGGLFILAALGPGHSRGAELPMLGVAALFFLPFALCWMEFVKRSYDVLIFRSPQTGAQIAFLNNVPSASTFSAFMEQLHATITAHRSKLPSVPKPLSQELRELAKLRDEGVLTEPD
jgi:hypothetical protein